MVRILAAFLAGLLVGLSIQRQARDLVGEEPPATGTWDPRLYEILDAVQGGWTAKQGGRTS